MKNLRDKIDSRYMHITLESWFEQYGFHGAEESRSLFDWDRYLNDINIQDHDSIEVIARQITGVQDPIEFIQKTTPLNHFAATSYLIYELYCWDIFPNMKLNSYEQWRLKRGIPKYLKSNSGAYLCYSLTSILDISLRSKITKALNPCHSLDGFLVDSNIGKYRYGALSVEKSQCALTLHQIPPKVLIRLMWIRKLLDMSYPEWFDFIGKTLWPDHASHLKVSS